MTVSIVECSKCHNSFNYEWSWGASPSSIKGGNSAIFKCPICKELNSFNLANRGRDPAFPTFNDLQVGLGGRIWGLLLGPFLLLTAMGVMLSITLAASPYFPLSLVLFLAGIAWVVAYVYHLNKRLGR
jgi:hypothetical protein